MMNSEEMLQSLVEKAENRERKARRRALLYSLAPIVLAVALVAFTGWQVFNANLQLVSIRSQVTDLSQTNQQLAQDQAQLKATNSDLTHANQGLAGQNQDLSGKLSDTQSQLSSTQNQLDAQKKELEAARQETAALNAKVASLQAQITDLENQLKLATRFQTFQFRGSWEETVKSMYNRPESRQVPDLLIFIMDNEKIPWRLDGTNPRDGFNSPRFAAYILQQKKLADVDPAKIQTADDLMKLLPVRRGGPKDGDVVFYPEGYTMFYFTDESGRPFVVGMTPLGVQVLDAGFANPLGVATVISGG